MDEYPGLAPEEVEEFKRLMEIRVGQQLSEQERIDRMIRKESLQDKMNRQRSMLEEGGGYASPTLLDRDDIDELERSGFLPVEGLAGRQLSGQQQLRSIAQEKGISSTDNDLKRLADYILGEPDEEN